ncbi:MAG: histone deacetylase family protein [Hyphomicrobiaceae bacterium]|nr:histone deacetylase family protein [Hyphomicrobiaceae bacterium]
MPTLLITHPTFVEHDTGPHHPERPDRMRAIDRVLAHELFNGLERADAPLRDDVENAILLAHPKRYLDDLKSKRPGEGEAPVRLDPDTILSPTSWEPALRAVGAGMMAVDAVMDPKASGTRNAFCQIRPCGHHAEAERAMGFCLFSNIAIAGLYARKRYGLERVAVVDFDVHHGNGTQDIFWSDKDLFFASSHQMPLFPGTGAPSETGVGNIVNAPLRSGDAGDKLREAYESRVLPALRNFSPDIILISAGFDAHEADPLASLRMVEADFMWVTEQILEIAETQCDGRVVSMLEGGYDLSALGRSVAVHVRTLMNAAG